MKRKYPIEIAGKTDKGSVRSQNEDAVLFSSDGGYAVLADGMGGYNAGEVASRLAVEAVQNILEKALRSQDEATHRSQPGSELLELAMQQANSAVLRTAAEEPLCQGMGTTLVAAVFQATTLHIAHVGDSRAYRFRNGALVQLTRDHSLLQEQIDAGIVSAEWAKHAQYKNLVTRAVGVSDSMEVEIHAHTLEAGDLYLLCSDGLSDMVPDDEIARILAIRQQNLQAQCDALIQAAIYNGGYDNVSVILARTAATHQQTEGVLHRLFGWATHGRKS